MGAGRPTSARWRPGHPKLRLPRATSQATIGYAVESPRRLLKLPANDRAELALALWDSLADGERDSELALSDEQRADLDRRWAQHVADPASAIPWADVRAKLLG